MRWNVLCNALKVPKSRNVCEWTWKARNEALHLRCRARMMMHDDENDASPRPHRESSSSSTQPGPVCVFEVLSVFSKRSRTCKKIPRYFAYIHPRFSYGVRTNTLGSYYLIFSLTAVPLCASCILQHSTHVRKQTIKIESTKAQRVYLHREKQLQILTSYGCLIVR